MHMGIWLCSDKELLGRTEVYNSRSWRVNQVELRRNFRDWNLVLSSQGREKTQSEEVHGVR